jgi:hypothetical protein
MNTIATGENGVNPAAGMKYTSVSLRLDQKIMHKGYAGAGWI